MSSDYRTGREGDFTYRGHTLQELQDLTIEEMAELVPGLEHRSDRSSGERARGVADVAGPSAGSSSRGRASATCMRS